MIELKFLQKFLHKKVYLETNTGRRYSGIVEEINELGNDKFIILIKDIKGMLIGVASHELVVIQEER